jgi:hypothetical protein
MRANFEVAAVAPKAVLDTFGQTLTLKVFFI